MEETEQIEDSMQDKPKRNPFQPVNQNQVDFFSLTDMEKKQRSFFEEIVQHEENGIKFDIPRIERLAYLIYINKGVFQPLSFHPKQRTIESPWEINLSLPEALELMFCQGYIRSVTETNPVLWVEMQSKMTDYIEKRLREFSKQIILA